MAVKETSAALLGVGVPERLTTHRTTAAAAATTTGRPTRALFHSGPNTGLLLPVHSLQVCSFTSLV